MRPAAAAACSTPASTTPTAAPPTIIDIFAARPECNFAPSVVNMTSAPILNQHGSDRRDRLAGRGRRSGPGLRAALLSDRNFSARPSIAWAASTTTSTARYAFVSYFLTGENRPYNRKMGVFDRVKPYEDFFRVRTCDGNVGTGHGAWELAYRFSYIDMLDGLNARGPAWQPITPSV